MVVILLLTPHTSNGCDGGSDESSTLSTTSTGATAIPSNEFQAYQSELRETKKPTQPHTPSYHNEHTTSSLHPSNCFRITYIPTPTRGDGHAASKSVPHCSPSAQHKMSTSSPITASASSSPSPSPPPLPKSRPPYELLYPIQEIDERQRVNAVPKPPRGKLRANQRTHMHRPPADTPGVQKSGPPKDTNKENICGPYAHPQHRRLPPKTTTNTEDVVRHVTRVNFYDIDTLQVDYEPKDEDDDCDTEAITKEEEWITKRKTELTTTRQIETRVKRQVVLEDGKVVEDSGPIVSTNTTEDTDKQETETTEKRDLGIPDKNHPPQQSVTQGALEDGSAGQLLAVNGTVVTKLLARPQDGLVRETNEKRIVSHEEIKDYLETEDVRHLGDFSDETYINAVNKAENLQEVLLSAAQHKSLVPTDPRIIVNTSKSRKTVDTEDLLKRSFAQPDGTLVTETKNTTEHEVIIDEELPDKDDHSAGSHERITTVEARQRFFKQRDEQNVDLVANGKVIGTEMRYAAETMQLEKDGSLERAGDWDSLSDRMRKLRKPQKSLLQQQKEAALMADRKDALTKRPLDFDREEETRKGETMKWLESHFGSESTASNDSREDTEVEPTKRTFFNVTIKSNHAPNEGPSMDQHLGANALDKEYQKKSEPPSGVEKTQYFQGISNWTERKHLPTNHFATKAFREDLRETVERNRLKKSAISGSRDQLSDSIQNISDPRDNYVSRADILHQKRQSLSSQFLAKSKRESVDKITSHNDPLDYKSGSQTDIRYMGSEDQKRFQTNAYSSSMFMLNEGNRNEMREPRVDYSGGTGRRKDYEVGRVRNSIVESDHVPKYTFETYTLRKESRIPSPDHMQMQTKTLDRPTVPQRKRLAERKLRQQMSAPPETTGVFEIQNKRAEPPPDYSPPPRSRSASPQIDYIIGSENKTPRSIAFDSGTSNVGTARKLHQRTRFAPTSLPPHSPVTQYSPRPKMSTQTTQTTPSNISSSTATSHKSNKVGQVIGNSIRKLVSKIRSASAERKFRMKSKSKSREQSPSTQNVERTGDVPQSTTYQQYNLIDSHIGDAMNGHQFEFDTMKPSYSMSNLNKREPSVHSGSTTQNREKSKTVKHSQQAELYSNQREIDSVVNPRQRYYLGEDPYSSTLYGKENMHDVSAVRNRSREMESTINRRNYRDSVERERPEKDSYMRHRNISSNTLGRYQKSSQRLAGSTPNLSNEYRSTKTLPRKLPDHHEYHQEHEESELDGRTQYQTAPTTTGPAKPARAYSKSLSRSKSFNIHGLNGSMENTAIYIENLGGKQNNHHVSNSNYAYRKDPYVGASSRDNSMLQSGLKSPSIVNLISRSQKDLTKLDLTEGESEIYDKYADKDTVTSDLYRGQEDKRKVFLKGLHQQAPDLYHTLHGDGHDLSHESSSKYPLKAMHSLQSRPSVQLNKDTASIIRGGVVRTEHQHPSLVHKEKHQLYVSDQRRRGSNATIIEVNRK